MSSHCLAHLLLLVSSFQSLSLAFQRAPWLILQPTLDGTRMMVNRIGEQLLN
ncbi:hypothetical protein KC19_5G053900 [Ceratodon purpureus]|uniref:Uncharacterized protein n=1 Tax=Ceratodon purpureus TaxID=3225 RepID=A0A8T0HY51_CERPU|nr:hypothetical protein KC19_5G053900 [Ceratodon purpureus]